MDLFFIIIISIISLGALFGLIRFIKGPTTSDRVVALDTLSAMLIAVLVLLAFIFNRYIYIDVSLIYAVLGFIGIITIARYLEGGI
jgi:multicomponent Na+:H+ antiporter subunit F